MNEVSRDRVANELTGPLADLGLDLEAVELTPAGRSRLLRVAVDKDGGVTEADLVEASRVASQSLDATDAMGDLAYTLEVTSRGVDRPLTLPRHWRRNLGRLVKVTLNDGSSVTGRIVEAGEAACVLAGVDDRREVGYDSVSRAIVQIEFNPRRDEEGI